MKAALLAAEQDPNISRMNKVTTGVTRRIRRMALWKKLAICLVGLSGVVAYFYLPIDDERADRVARLMCLTPTYSAPNNSSVVHCNTEAARQAQLTHFAAARTYYGQGARIAATLPFAKSSVKAIMGYKKMQARVEYNLLLKMGTKPKALPDHLAFYSILQQVKQLRGADNHSKTLQLQRGLAEETATLGRSSLPLENQYELAEVETILGDIAMDIAVLVNSKADIRAASAHYQRALEIAREHQGDVPPNEISTLEAKLALCNEKLVGK
jgi:hypothetical protein